MIHPLGSAMIELSPGTIERIHKLFPENEWAAVEDALGSHAVFDRMTAPAWSELAERVRFAVLKLSGGQLDALRHCLDEAAIDWRDTLMAAGFGRDTSAHKDWKP